MATRRPIAPGKPMPLPVTEADKETSAAAEALPRDYPGLSGSAAKTGLSLAEENRMLSARLAQHEKTRGLLTHILDSLKTGVLVMTAAGRIVTANISARMLLGGESASPVLPDVVRHRVLNFHESRNGGRAETAAPEIIVCHGRDGRLLSCSLSPFPPADETSEQAVLVLVEDVTEQVLVGEQRERTQSLAAMGEMAAEVAHQIRNPLGGIELFASILGREVKEEENLDRLVGNVLGGVREINHLITNYLTLARPPVPIRQPVRLDSVLEEALDAAEESLKQSRIDVKFNRSEPVWVEADRELLMQVALNAILNAIEAQPDGGALHIGLTASPGQAGIFFRDKGRGIPSRDLGRIFNPFFTTKQKNLGLGLAVSHRIIDAHQGFIQVKSRPGQGTTVTLTLPLLTRGTGTTDVRS